MQAERNFDEICGQFSNIFEQEYIRSLFERHHRRKYVVERILHCELSDIQQLEEMFPDVDYNDIRSRYRAERDRDPVSALNVTAQYFMPDGLY